MVYKLAMWCLVLGLVAACDDAQSSLADLQSACSAGSAEACAEVEARERQIKAYQNQLNGKRVPGSQGCSQGFEGEVTCI